MTNFAINFVVVDPNGKKTTGDGDWDAAVAAVKAAGDGGTLAGNFDGTTPDVSGNADDVRCDVTMRAVDIDGTIVSKPTFGRSIRHITRNYFGFDMVDGIAYPVSIRFFSDRTGYHTYPTTPMGGRWAMYRDGSVTYITRGYSAPDVADGTHIAPDDAIWV